MNYPKMIYLGEAKYTDSASIRDDLINKSIKTVIVATDGEEAEYRKQGYVDLAALIKQQRKTLTLPEKPNGGVNAS